MVGGGGKMGKQKKEKKNGRLISCNSVLKERGREKRGKT